MRLCQSPSSPPAAFGSEYSSVALYNLQISFGCAENSATTQTQPPCAPLPNSSHCARLPAAGQITHYRLRFALATLPQCLAPHTALSILSLYRMSLSSSSVATFICVHFTYIPFLPSDVFSLSYGVLLRGRSRFLIIHHPLKPLLPTTTGKSSSHTIQWN